MQIRQLNEIVFTWSRTHPARRFLEEFIKFRKSVIREKLSPEIDQEFVTREGANTSFKAFLFTWLSFDIVLDGWLTNAPSVTHDEQRQLAALPEMRDQLLLCQEAAIRDGNSEMIRQLDRAFALLILWENCITSRVQLRSQQCTDGNSGR